MKACSLIVILICCVCKHTSVDIMPQFKRNNLNFGYTIDFKYKGMLEHSFNRFYVGTKFILPTMEDLKFLPIEFDSTCNYMDVNLNMNHFQLNLF